jgi:hypothetical protein
MALMVNAASPVFLSVIVFAALVLPTAVAGKA